MILHCHTCSQRCCRTRHATYLSESRAVAHSQFPRASVGQLPQVGERANNSHHVSEAKAHRLNTRENNIKHKCRYLFLPLICQNMRNAVGGTDGHGRGPVRCSQPLSETCIADGCESFMKPVADSRGSCCSSQNRQKPRTEYLLMGTGVLRSASLCNLAECGSADGTRKQKQSAIGK